MKKRMTRIFGIFCALVFCSVLWCRAEEVPMPDSGVVELMSVSGMQKMIEQIPTLVGMGLLQAQNEKKQMSQEGFEFLQKCAVEAFSASAMMKRIQDHVAGKLPAEKRQKLLEWYKGPLAAKMIKIESESVSVEKIPEMKVFMENLEKAPLPEARVKLLTRLDKATRGTEFNVEMMVKTQFGMMKAMNQLLSPEKRQKEETFKEAEQKARNEFRSSLEQQVMGTWGYVYKDLPDDELEKYIAFYEGPLGSEWAGIVGEALVVAMEAASTDMGAQLMKKAQSEASTPAKK